MNIPHKSPFDIVDRSTIKASSLKSPENLRTKTQKTALLLLEREETNGKKSRLVSLLEHQFIAKYGSKNPKSHVNSFIKDSIVEFIDRYVNIHDAEKHVSELEAEVRDGSRRLRDELKTTLSVNMQEEATNVRRSNPSTALPLSNAQNEKRSVPRLEDFTGNQWPIINALITVSEEEKKQKEMQAILKKKRNFKNALDEQLDQHKRLQEQQLTEKQRILNMLEQVQHKEQIEEEQKKKHREIKVQSERELRLQQIEEQKQHREMERQRKINEERVEMARAKRMAEEEEFRKQEVKRKQKEDQDRLLQENEYNRQIKAAVLKEKQEYEKRLAEEYERKLEAEEQARTAAFRSRMDHLNKIAKGYESKVGTVLQQQKEEEEALRRKQLEERDRKQEERERREKEMRITNAHYDLNFNKTMINKKQEEKERERQAAVELRLRLEQEAVEAKKAEREAAEKRRQKHELIKMNLDRQMAQVQENRRREKSGLSEVELNINKTMLKQLEDDPNLMSKVMDRLQQQQQGIQSSRSAAATGKPRSNASTIFN